VPRSRPHAGSNDGLRLHPRDWSLRTKLVVLSLALSLMPLLTLGVVDSLRAREVARHDAELAMLAGARSTVTALDRANLARQQLAVLVASTDLAVSAVTNPAPDAEAVNRMINAFQTASKSVNGIYLLDRTGKTLFATDPTLMNRVYDFRPYFREAFAGHLYTSDVSVGIAVQRPILVSSAPIRLGSEIVGVAAVRTDVTDVFDVVDGDRNALGPRASGLLLDANGIRLYDGSDASLQFKAIVQPSDDVREQVMQEKQFGAEGKLEWTDARDLAAGVRDAAQHPSFTFVDQGETWHGTAMQLQTKNWSYVLRAPQSTFMAGVDEMTRSALIVIAIAALIAGAISILMAASIARPVRQLEADANRLASGDLSEAEGTTGNRRRGRDEVGRMARAFGAMLGQLRQLAAEVQEGAQSLSGAGEAILAAVAQQSAGATAQSAAIAQTTATVEEVKASAQQAAALAESVAATAREADRIASEGVNAVQDATGGMTNIREKVESIAEQILALSEQSQQIGEIIATVGDLADQSNMLALNAAIEATRAGEHGRGFAVVAQEIRALAEQSKAATAQVRAILSDIQRATNAAVMATEQGTKGVDAGARLIDRAGETITELAGVIQDASTSAQQITAAVRQHSVGMEQIVAAMADIHRATTQNLSATGSTQHAAEELTTLARRLAAVVARYRVTPASEPVGTPAEASRDSGLATPRLLAA
jgi:methyl-accepting chemotaxis protein